MNLRHLNYFINVVKAGSITKAATALNMSQPALSRQIRVFENELGWQLLDRGAKSIQLTYAGEMVHQEGLKILSQVEQGHLRMKRAIDGGVLRIGFAPSLGANLLKKAISCFSQRHPQVNIQLHDCSSEEMRMKLLAGELELMLEVQSKEKEFDWRTLTSLDNVLALPESHPLLNQVSKNKLPIKSLEGEKFLLLSRFDYPSYWAKVSEYFSANGVNVKVAGEFDGIDSMGVALDAGLGIALVSINAKLPAGVKLIELEPKPAPAEVAVGWNASRPLDAITEEFIEELSLAADSFTIPK